MEGVDTESAEVSSHGLPPLNLPPPLQRFFNPSSLGLPDPEHTRFFYNQLDERVPRRGRPRWQPEKPRSAQLQRVLESNGSREAFLRGVLACLEDDGYTLTARDERIASVGMVAHMAAINAARR